jgi:aspartate kinase
MALIVQKFGGTSMADLARIGNSADWVLKAKQAGHDVVVVVSAMAGETDRLIGLAKAVQDQPNPREYAALVATGEQVTMALMTMTLQAKGLSALSLTGWQAGMITNDHYKKARIHTIQTQRMQSALKEGQVVVIAGFQGMDERGNVTTLGRGGSDTSAVAIAAALHADECQIFTDVEGIFTTDPNMVPEAQRLDSVTFEEMLELASLGSKVLQIRSVEFAGKYNVPLRVLSSMKAGPGTLIRYDRAQSTESPMEAPLVSGIAFSRQECKIVLSGLNDPLQSLAKILSLLNALGINIDMLTPTGSSSSAQVALTVHADDYHQALSELTTHAAHVGAKQVNGEDKLAKLSIVGAGLKSHPQITATFFETIAAQGIPIQLIAMSEIKISVVIPAAQLEQGVKALHQAYHLDQDDETSYDAEEVPIENSVVYSEN